jgi:hypothetical protein
MYAVTGGYMQAKKYYCHVLSDYRRVLDFQLDLLGLSTVTMYYTSQLNTAAATLLASPAITY